MTEWLHKWRRRWGLLDRDDKHAAGFWAFNFAYGLGCVAILILVPVPHWGSGWLLAVAWPLIVLFLAGCLGGVADAVGAWPGSWDD
jgi:hypothetical protein